MYRCGGVSLNISNFVSIFSDNSGGETIAIFGDENSDKCRSNYKLQLFNINYDSVELEISDLSLLVDSSTNYLVEEELIEYTIA